MRTDVNMLLVRSQVLIAAVMTGPTSKPSPSLMRGTNLMKISFTTLASICMIVVAGFALPLLAMGVVFDTVEMLRKRRNGPVRVAAPWMGRNTLEEDTLLPVRDRGAHGSFLMKKMWNESGLDIALESRCNSVVNLLGSLQHKNIIRIKSQNRREAYMELIYELPGVANGNLYEWLHCPSTERTPRVLSWPMRRAIIMGVAKGLFYMHHGRNRPIIHHNLSSTNILLDMSFKATISSFDHAETGIAGLDQPLPISEIRIGNYGYAAPEYGGAIGGLTQKVDVYSFGVLMLEIVSGRVAYQNDGNCPLLLATWAEMYLKQLSGTKNTAFCNTEAVDPEIPESSRYNKEMAAVFELGLKCTVQDLAGRPSIKKVIKQLQKRGRGSWTWTPDRDVNVCIVGGHV